MEAPFSILQVSKIAAFAEYQFAMSFFIRHQQRHRASNNIGGLIVALPKSGNDFLGDDPSGGPGRCDRINANGNTGIELNT
jgi:hypothetical protein